MATVAIIKSGVTQIIPVISASTVLATTIATLEVSAPDPIELLFADSRVEVVIDAPAVDVHVEPAELVTLIVEEVSAVEVC